MRRRKVVFWGAVGPMAAYYLVYVGVRIYDIYLRFNGRYAEQEALRHHFFVIGLPALLVVLVFFYVGAAMEPVEHRLWIENRTGHRLIIEILGLPEDHDMRRMPLAKGETIRPELDTQRDLGLCLGTGVVAYDESGVEIVRVSEPLCTTNRMVIEHSGERYIGHVGGRYGPGPFLDTQ